MERYDAAIIGSGPAGLEAAINLKIRNKRFIFFGSDNLSRKIVTATRVDNYLGLPAISGMDLQARFIEHLTKMDIDIVTQQIQMIYSMGDFFSLASSQDTYEATTVILATGIAHTKMLPGEEAFLGRGVGYCATCDAPLYRGKTVAVLGYTDEAVHEANYVAEIAEKVYYIPMAKTSFMPDAEVEIIEGPVAGVTGDTLVRQLEVAGKSVPVDGVFILREAVAPAALMPGIAMNGNYIAVNVDMETNIPGCYAAGDCTGKPHQYIRAAGQGQTAALSAVSYIDNMKKEKKNPAADK